MNDFIFEHRYRNQVWRFQVTIVHGNPTVSVWPWFTSSEGDLRPGAARYGGGFQMPAERLADLRDAIDRAIKPGE